MAKQFAIESWEGMDESERILLCKQMTQTAMNLAKASSPNLSQALLRLAQAWSLVANEVSRESAGRVNRKRGINSGS